MAASNRVLPLVLQLLTLGTLSTSFYYNKARHDTLIEETEARFDELEGTLRGHIGLIEDSLERIEGKKWMGGMSERAEKLYGERERDAKK